MSDLYAVFGATGAQGGAVLDAALEAGLAVRAVSRDPRARVGHFETVAADFDDAASIERALSGVTAAFVHLPLPKSPDEPARFLATLLDAAARARPGHLVFTTSGPASARWRQVMPIAGNAASARAALGGPVPAIVLQPNLYLENLRVPLFVPRLATEGVLDYPPLPAHRPFSWTSQRDQAAVAVAALRRPDLAGQVFEIASRGPLTGLQLAGALSRWTGRPVHCAPLSPRQFGARVAAAIGNPGIEHVLDELYSALAEPDGTEARDLIDVTAVERAFGVRLHSVEERIASWAA